MVQVAEVVEETVIEAPAQQDPGPAVEEAPSTPTVPVAVPEPVQPVDRPAPVTRRKKRPRVVAPAGPPTGAAAVITVDDLAAPATHQ